MLDQNGSELIVPWSVLQVCCGGYKGSDGDLTPPDFQKRRDYLVIHTHAPVVDILVLDSRGIVVFREKSPEEGEGGP